MDSLDIPIIEAEVRFWGPKEGGRARLPSIGYKPHLVVSQDAGEQQEAAAPDKSDLLGVILLNEPRALVSRCQFLLAYFYKVDYAALQPGTSFSVREGRRIVGEGRVLRFVDD